MSDVIMAIKVSNFLLFGRSFFTIMFFFCPSNTPSFFVLLSLFKIKALHFTKKYDNLKKEPQNIRDGLVDVVGYTIYSAKVKSLQNSNVKSVFSAIVSKPPVCFDVCAFILEWCLLYCRALKEE